MLTRSFICLAAASFLFSLSAQAQKSKAAKPAAASASGFTLTGQLKNGTGKIYLEEMGAGGFVKKDSATLGPDGGFRFTGKVAQPSLYKLTLADKSGMLVVLENKPIQVEGDAADLNNTAKQSGTKEADLLQEVRRIRNGTQARYKTLSTRFNANQNNADSVRILGEHFEAAGAQEVAALKTLVRRQPASVVSLYTTMNYVNPAENLAFADSMLAVYRKMLPALPYVPMLDAKLTKLHQTAVGAPAPDIRLMSPEGKEVALSGLKGQYVLIDFWASWCGPCRRENPNVVKLYNQYKDKGFTIYSVSLDDNRDKWLKAIADDQLTWTHVSDLKGWQSSAGQAYSINAIPATVLLDRDGRIMAKNLRGEALEKKLAEILP